MSRSNQNPIVAVNLMLDDPGRPAGEGFVPGLKPLILAPLGLSHSEQRKLSPPYIYFLAGEA